MRRTTRVRVSGEGYVGLWICFVILLLSAVGTWILSGINRRDIDGLENSTASSFLLLNQAGDLQNGKLSVLENEEGVQNGKLSALETDILLIQQQISGLDGNVTELAMLLEVKNNTQRIIQLEQTTTVQNGRLSSLESQEGVQNGRLSTLEAQGANHSGRLGFLETKTLDLMTTDVTQDGRLSSLESQEGVQNGRLSALESQDGIFQMELTALTQATELLTNTSLNLNETVLHALMEVMMLEPRIVSLEQGQVSLQNDVLSLNQTIQSLDVGVVSVSLENPPAPLAVNPVNGNLLTLMGTTNVEMGLRGGQSVNEGSNTISICHGDSGGAIAPLAFFWMRIQRMVFIQVGANGVGTLNKSAGHVFSLGVGSCVPASGLPGLSFIPSISGQTPVSVSCSNGQFNGYAQMVGGQAPFLRVFMQQSITNGMGCVFNGLTMMWATDDA